MDRAATDRAATDRAATDRDATDWAATDRALTQNTNRVRSLPTHTVKFYYEALVYEGGVNMFKPSSRPTDCRTQVTQGSQHGERNTLQPDGIQLYRGEGSQAGRGVTLTVPHRSGSDAKTQLYL